MTKERKLEILKDLLIQLSDSANILCTCEADERCEVVEECINALEQQPCDDVMAIHTQGLDEGIRCAMCTNSMKSDSGCDGGCIVDNDMYKKVMDTIDNHIFSQLTSEDCVSRKAALDILSHYAHNFGADTEIKALPPVTPTRKVGKWIYDSGSYKCPFCEHEITGKENDLNYCCKCGAEMRLNENG